MTIQLDSSSVDEVYFNFSSGQVCKRGQRLVVEGLGVTVVLDVGDVTAIDFVVNVLLVTVGKDNRSFPWSVKVFFYYFSKR